MVENQPVADPQDEVDDIQKKLDQLNTEEFLNAKRKGKFATQNVNELLSLVLYTLRKNEREKTQLFARLYKLDSNGSEINPHAIELLRILWEKDAKHREKDLAAIKDLLGHGDLTDYNISQTYDQFKTLIFPEEVTVAETKAHAKKHVAAKKPKAKAPAKPKKPAAKKPAAKKKAPAKKAVKKKK